MYQRQSKQFLGTLCQENMIPNRLYYTWKVRGDDGELYTPHSDPNTYEYPFDLLFESKEQAYESFEPWGIVDMYWDQEEEDEELPNDWKPEGWLLCRTSVEIVDA